MNKTTFTMSPFLTFRRRKNKREVHVWVWGVVSGDGGLWGGGGLTIREKFRPVKVSLLPIVLLIKTAPAPVLIEGLSLARSPSLLLSRQLVCEEKAYHTNITVLPSTSNHTAINIASITVKGTGWDMTIMKTSSTKIIKKTLTYSLMGTHTLTHTV